MQMTNAHHEAGLDELRDARRQSRVLYWSVGVFSFFVNLLMLTGPIYMLQVYDRVLGSRSVETLIALSALVLFLYAMMGFLDYARGRVMGRVAARFQARLDRRVFDAVNRKAAVAPDDNTETGLRDLESVQRLMASPVLMAAFDMPWTPIFLLGIWLFHPLLGAFAIIGGLTLIAVAFLNQTVTRRPAARSNSASVAAEKIANQIRGEAEMVQAMGMRDATFDRWKETRDIALETQIQSSDLLGTFSVTTKTFRLFLQSAMLGLGAFLVLEGSLTPGAMIAGSILLGRALAPVELAVGQWPAVHRAVRGWSSLADLLGSVPPERAKIPLPRPQAHLEVHQLTVFPPGEKQASLRGVSFVVHPGEAIGVIGPSGAGKSSLARALTGVWPPMGGKIRLDGATLDQYQASTLGALVGYLPQRVQLFDGTIAENIARLATNPDPAKTVEAAKKADAHKMILKLPDGYDTRVTPAGGRLSGGQMQRIGLARAMYGDPVMLVLDEPNSNLDNEGSDAVNRAIRGFKEAGRSILIMAHRPAAIQECDKLLMLDGGRLRAFGPKEDVLRNVVKNHLDVIGNTGLRGVQ